MAISRRLNNYVCDTTIEMEGLRLIAEKFSTCFIRSNPTETYELIDGNWQKTSGISITIGIDPPVSPTLNQLWIDTN